MGEPQPDTTPFLWAFLYPRCLFTPLVGMLASCHTRLASFSGRQFFLVCWAWCPPAMLLITLNVLFSCLSHWTMQAKSHPSSIPLYNFMDSAAAALGDPFVSLRESILELLTVGLKNPHWGLPMLLTMWNSIPGPTNAGGGGHLHRRLLSSTDGLLEFGRDGQQKIHQIPCCRKRQNPQQGVL